MKKLNLKVNETLTVGNKVIKKVSKNHYRIGEVMGDWIASGTKEEILLRLNKG